MTPSERRQLVEYLEQHVDKMKGSPRAEKLRQHRERLEEVIEEQKRLLEPSDTTRAGGESWS
jgi:hypothetical protein